MAITGGLAVGALGVGEGLFGKGGMFGGKTDLQNVQLPPQFNMPNMGGAAQGAYSGIQNLPGTQLGQQTTPMAWQTAQNLYNNPYAGGYQAGAGMAGGLGQAGALNQFGAGGSLYGAGAGLLGDAQSLWAAGADPQGALYNRTLGQVTDQTRAGEAARGIGTSPYGAGVENTALSNFNIDWQNNQLQRLIQGAQGAGNLTGVAGSAFNNAAGMQAGAANNFLAASTMPYGAYGAIGQGQFGALGGAQNVAQGGQGLAMTPINAYEAYLGTGNQAGGVANQGAGLALNQAQAGWQQQQQQLGNLGFGLGAGGASMGQAFPNLGFGGRSPQGWAPPMGQQNAYAGYNVTGTPYG